MNDGARRILFFDGSAGASGDMILGALVDLGVPLARLRRDLSALSIGGFRLRSRRVERCGLAARKIDVRVDERGPERGWSAIRRIVRTSGLPAEVRDLSLRVFRRLIDAEAVVHGLPPERVHLHEAGGSDAIVDVVGAALGLVHLGADRIVVSPLTTGFGSVRCAHGVYPVPGPATLELLRGVPACAGSIEAERLTPTGAAILTTVADAFTPMPLLRPLRIGHGAGDRELEAPNVLRVVLGEDLGTADPVDSDVPATVAVLECTVDDATPQALAWAVEQLLAAGALDAFVEAVTMKKGRSGHRLTVLGRPEDRARLARIVLTETTTLGLRYRDERRIELERAVRRVRTRYGSVEVKVARLDGRPVHAWPEYERCAELAREHGVPLQAVQQAALRRLPAADALPSRSRAGRLGRSR